MNKKAKKLADDERREAILRMIAEGYTQEDVGRRFGIGQPRICKIYQGELARLAESRKEYAATALDNELARLQSLEQRARRTEALAIKGWRRSLADRVKQTAVVRVKDGSSPAQPDEQRVEREAQSGDPAFIAQMLRSQQQRLAVVERRCRLLGLDAPDKHALVNTKGEDLLEKAMRGLSPALLADLSRRSYERWSKQAAREKKE